MGLLKRFVAKGFARLVKLQTDSWANAPVKTQRDVFNNLINKGRKTAFGKDHGFDTINSYKDFIKQVPVRDYESLKPYMDRAVSGEKDVVWPGKPLYFAKTSGTTSGSKYIPLTKESMPTHIKAARNALLLYIAETGDVSFVDGKMIFLQGSPVLSSQNGIQVGRLSGIVAHFVPGYLQKNRLPSFKTNSIEDWEIKVNAIVEETIDQNMTLISGIPPWVQMYFEKLIEKSGSAVGDLFKNFNLFVYGGVNYEPYRQKLESLIGRPVNAIELYPASEGFFAFQDKQGDKGMLLQLNSGIFYEFIKAEEFFNDNPNRLTIKDVELHTNYVLIVSTTAGLWAYNVGDTIMFTSLKPFRLIVTGRIKHFISAFGEHVIGKEVEEAINAAVQEHKAEITEFTVAPNITPKTGLPFHEWLIEFSVEPENIDLFAATIDEELKQQNSYYSDLITGKVLQPLKITTVKPMGFKTYMKSIGKLGGQNKLPRLSNDRNIADQLVKLNVIK